MVHFTGLLENARHPCGGTPGGGPLSLDPCKNRVRAGIGGWPGTATGGQIHVVHISHTHPPKEIIQALRKYLLGKISFGKKRGEVYVCGNNSSVAGLTAAVHREGGDFAVEAGALVLADP